MNYTIRDLFVAIHYCNKMVKDDTFVGIETRKDFYRKKRNLLYHMIRNHKELGIEISDCHIDIQNSLINNKPNRLYAFCLTHDGTELKVHQREYAKLTQLFQILKFTSEVTGDYAYTHDESLTFNRDLLNESLNIIKVFHNEWNLNKYVSNLNDPSASTQDVYDSLVYYFPDFKFTAQMKGSTIGKHTVIQITHKNSGRTYYMPLNMLKAHGEKYLPHWREEHRFFKHCIID